MVSGHGARGGRGRCYTLWTEFMACVAKNNSISMNVCQKEREDYMECLHHTKLVSDFPFVDNVDDHVIFPPPSPLLIFETGESASDD